MLDALLDAASGLSALATSREALGLRGEMILPVKPLDFPPPDATPEQVWGTDAARLFLQAAELASPLLTFDDDDAPTVAAICRQLDGIPLALELAASQLQVVSPQQLLTVLGQRFGLALGGRRQLPRQQTLQAVIRWSVDNLSELERKVLSALAVCAGGCDLAATQAVVGSAVHSDSVIPSLAGLADRSLMSVQHVAAQVF
jgi:predicted ATPase